MSSKWIRIILSYTISKLTRFLRHSVYSNVQQNVLLTLNMQIENKPLVTNESSRRNTGILLRALV